MSLLSENRASLQPTAPVNYVLGQAGTSQELRRSRSMRRVIRGGLIGALVLGGLVFLGMLLLTISEGARFHALPAWLIAGIYGAGGAVVGLLVGGILGAVRRYKARAR
jgi:hypothetical protein